MKPRFRLNWEKGAKQKVERLVAGGIDVDEPVDNYGFTLLHHAVDVGSSASQKVRDESFSISVLLLENGADCNVRDYCGRTPLMLAAASFNTSVVRELIKRYCNIDCTCCYGKTALHYTALNPGIEVAEILVEKGALVNCTDCHNMSPLTEAIKLSNSALVEFLEKCSEKKSDYTAVSGIHHAAFWGREDVLRRLIICDVDFESRDKHGQTPLIVAVRSGKYSTAKLLLDSGAKVNTVDNREFSALHWACKQGLADLLRLVLQYGANTFDRTSVMLCFSITVGEDCSLKTYKVTSSLLSHLFDYGCEILPIINHSEFSTVHPVFRLFVCNHLRRSMAGLFFCPSDKDVRSDLVCVQSWNKESLDLPMMRMKKVSCKNLDKLLRECNSQFCTDCKREIAMMKTISLGKISLFDVLIKPVELLSNYITFENIHYILTNEKCSDNLQIYWGMIESKLEKLIVKKTYIESTQHFFTFLRPVLPYDCIELILKYLSFEDMKYVKPVVFKLELASVR